MTNSEIEGFTFESWRRAVRPWLAAGHKAEGLLWRDGSDQITAASTDCERGNAQPAGATLCLPRVLMTLLQNLACFRHPSRWEFMYRLAWRVLYENPGLLADPADPDVANATTMDRAVRRDLHKMHAFVRFREMAADDGTLCYFAWFEPQHEILRPGALFFAKRFPNMCWTIATPDGAAAWDTKAIDFAASRALADRPREDNNEHLWRTYYRSICNVARINPKAMQREMPKHYWNNLPEATEIATLMRDGAARFAARQKQGDHENFTVAKSLQRSLAQAQVSAAGIQLCRACDLWKHATQAVDGEGPRSAQIMLVGEQPGDEEDLRGRPFIGPAGKLLDDALQAAGLQRGDIYITNAVKHFKWEPRGKRRLHKRPGVREIRACNVWLRNEIDLVRPLVIVALGMSALTALLGSSNTIEAARAMDMNLPSGGRLVASYHPSSILRADAERGARLREALVEDLRRASSFLSSHR
ncbi:MAG: UdgX family uracil-DNA binding protein [Pseudomonadota bacterium]|nr:UdgX family uracil-DNA binding protein [Pseudomonadota bacterium]